MVPILVLDHGASGLGILVALAKTARDAVRGGAGDAAAA
jgi:hypothetical protein